MAGWRNARNRSVYVRWRTWRQRMSCAKLGPWTADVDEKHHRQVRRSPQHCRHPPRQEGLAFPGWAGPLCLLLLVPWVGAVPLVIYSRAVWPNYKTEPGGFQRISFPMQHRSPTKTPTARSASKMDLDRARSSSCREARSCSRCSRIRSAVDVTARHCVRAVSRSFSRAPQGSASRWMSS